MKNTACFTTISNNIVPVLCNKIKISDSIEKSFLKKEYLAIWDTGATNTAISPKIVQECKLVPTGMTVVNTAAGQNRCYTYLIDLQLPNNVEIKNLPVTGADLNGADVLVGMDIISKGDFAISNFNGQTVFTFRMPSYKKTDYVEESKQKDIPIKNSNITIGRNTKCPCGSGKKYKQCHGKI